MSNPPKWAQDLTLNAMLYLESKGYRSDLPDMNWRHADRTRTGGVCHKDHITITAGRDRTDAKLVLLHELAHWVNPTMHHSDTFWDTAWDLFRWARLPVRYTLKRERHYRVGAAAAYHRTKGG